MALDIAEVMKKPGALATWADKVSYKMEMSQEEKEYTEYVDAWARQIGKTGHDRDHELAALIERTLTVEEVTAPSELISAMFDETTIGEFDDAKIIEDPYNTIQAYEAIIEGNVDRSFIEHKTFEPTWKTLAAETDVSMQDLRRGGYRTVASLTTYMREAMEFKKVSAILAAVDAAIVSGNPNYITESTALPTAASADALALYLMDMSTGARPVAFMLNKYLQVLSSLAQGSRWPTEEQKGIYNRDGVLYDYAGMKLLGYSGQRKAPDGTLLIPDKRVFGFAGRIGAALTRGETRVLQSEDINEERIHIKMTGYTFGYAITRPENAAKIVMAQ